MFFFRKRHSQPPIPPQPEHHTFILEPILTPSGLVDSPGDDTPDLDLVSDIPDFDDTLPETDTIDPFLDDLEDIPFFTDEPIKPQFESGYFTVGDSGKVGIDFLYDGGGYQGQLAIFSLEGMEDLDPNSEEFIREAAQRASSNSTDGYIIIDDASEGAKFSGKTAWEGNFNGGEYQRVKEFNMNPGDTFGIMLVPNGTVEQVADNPSIGGSIRPLFSLSTANPSDAFHVGQIADVTGDGNTFVMEDLRVDGWTDKDYNDIIFQVRGATGEAVDLDTVINTDRDWRSSDMGQALIEYAKGYTEEGNTTVVDVDAPSDQQPLIGIIDTGFSNENPDIDYDNITFGSDLIDGDDPFVNTGEDSKHGTHVLGIIGATQDNDMGIDGINDDAPIWISRAVGSGKWAESLVEFVDAARESGQPNAVVNLSMDLTQIDAEGNVSTRYEFTPLEMAALEYARHNDVLVAVAAGNDGAVMSALGQASEQFDNIITVGAADGLERAAYSSYGEGLDIMAQGGTPDNPIISTVGDDVDGMYGTSVATAQVTGAISQIWAANPELSYQQVIEILKQTATDINDPGVDAETGAGLLNMAAAVHLAKTIQKEEYEKELQPPNLSWSGEGIYRPMERAANGSSTGSGSVGSALSWGSFLGLFGNTKSASFSSFLKRIFNQFFNPLTIPDPDNNGTINKAKSIQSNDIVTDSVGTSDRNDVYTFDLTKPQYVEILLDGLKANANIELIQDGKVLFKSTKTGTNADSITQFLKPGKYYVKVSSNINNGTTPYNLKVRSWSSVQPDNGPQPINGKQPVTGKIDSVYFSDVTGDSLADALVVNNWGTTTRPSNDPLFLGNETWTENAYFGSRRTFFADVNGDGQADAVVVNNGAVTVRRSDGTQFLPNEAWTNNPYFGEFGTFFADVTGDGKADAIVVNNGGVTVRRSDGTKFLPNEAWTNNPYFGEFGTFFADVTGDGKADAIVVNNGGVTVRRSDGTKFLPNESWTDISYYGQRGTFFADVTGDGKADAIVVNNGGVTVRRSDGTKFLPNETWTYNPYFGQRGTFFADVTGDGKADAVVVNNGGVTVRRSDGTQFLPNETWTDNGYWGEGGPGTFVKGSGDEVYFIDGITRRHVPDPDTFQYLGGSLTPQNYISDSNLNGFALGTPLPSRRNGTLLRGRSYHEVYIMENGYRRHIPNPETFNAMGLNGGDIQVIADGDLNNIPLGSPIPPRSSDNYTPINNYSEYLNRLYGGSGVITRGADAHGGAVDSVKGLGANLYALAGGLVIEARNGINYGANSNNYNNWVNNGTIAIYNETMNKTFIYWHLQEGTIDESMEGKTIPTGALIGKEGKTGYSIGSSPNRWDPNWGVHTHVQVHEGRVNVNMALGQAPHQSTRLHLLNVLRNG